IINPIEMGWDGTAGGVPALITKMNASSYYPDLFAFAFGNSVISGTRIQQALAQFERAMVSAGSRWATAYAGVFNAAAPNRNLNVDLPGFSTAENLGRQLFMTGPNAGGAGCSACHVPPTFPLAANSDRNGLDAGETIIFKSPSLKNIALSGAFMHDGRFATLAQVVEHYNGGVQAGPALDNRLKGPGGVPQRLNLSDSDKAALGRLRGHVDRHGAEQRPQVQHAVQEISTRDGRGDAHPARSILEAIPERTAHAVVAQPAAGLAAIADFEVDIGAKPGGDRDAERGGVLGDRRAGDPERRTRGKAQVNRRVEVAAARVPPATGCRQPEVARPDRQADRNPAA
ncbi:MAG: hypothetical protein H7268_06115, partial [Sandarakinorhabdus sp.]|nr:hypothetical protein [Sandarakinorhabdus sp.]